MQKDTSKTCRIQDKGSRFVVRDSDSYIENIDYQFERSSFQQLDDNLSYKSREKVTLWNKKWKENKILDNSWCRFIENSHANPGKMYALFKTHKVGNPARVTTSGCGTAIENLSIFVEKRVFLKITLKTSLKVLLNVLEGSLILMRNLNSIVQNIKTI